jgi:hypothetical protein
MPPDKTDAEATFEDRGFHYKVVDGAAEIIRFPRGFEDLAAIPPALGGFPVKAVSAAAVECLDQPPPRYPDGEGEYVAPDGVVYDANLTVIRSVPHDLVEWVIPASVRKIDSSPLSWLFLKTIRVEEGSRHFSSLDGMLFNDDRSVLLAVPTDMCGVCNVPASVRVIDEVACHYVPNVTAFNVDPENENYCSVDGVIYTRDLSDFVLMPDGFVGKLTLPHGVRRVHLGHFRTANRLTSVKFPASVNVIVESNGLFSSDSLVSFEIHPDNPYYRSEDGVLFSKSGSRLIRCPPGKTGIYEIPTSVIFLGDHAFAGCVNLDRLDVPHQFQLLNDTVFESCEESVCVQHVTDRSSGGYEYGWLGCMEAFEDPCFYRAGQFSGEVMLAGVAETVEGHLAIPPTLGGRRVERIMRHAFGFVPNLTSISIPAEVARIDEHVFYACDSLSDISVAVDNPVLSSYDGCLYDKHQTRLIYCPNGREGLLKMPASLMELPEQALSECPHLSAFEVSAENMAFAHYDDALYDKKLTVLIRVPPLKRGVLSLPATVKQVCDNACKWCDWLTYAKISTRKRTRVSLGLPIPICWVSQLRPNRAR